MAGEHLSGQSRLALAAREELGDRAGVVAVVAAEVEAEAVQSYNNKI